MSYYNQNLAEILKRANIYYVFINNLYHVRRSLMNTYCGMKVIIDPMIIESSDIDDSQLCPDCIAELVTSRILNE